MSPVDCCSSPSSSLRPTEFGKRAGPPPPSLCQSPVSSPSNVSARARPAYTPASATTSRTRRSGGTARRARTAAVRGASALRTAGRGQVDVAGRHLAEQARVGVGTERPDGLAAASNASGDPRADEPAGWRDPPSGDVRRIGLRRPRGPAGSTARADAPVDLGDAAEQASVEGLGRGETRSDGSPPRGAALPAPRSPVVGVLVVAAGRDPVEQRCRNRRASSRRWSTGCRCRDRPRA